MTRIASLWIAAIVFLAVGWAGCNPATAKDQQNASNNNSVSIGMLFYHEPNYCPHCAYEMPQVRKFERIHREVKVIWRDVGSSLSEDEQKLLEGTSGHPIMVFYSGKNRMVVSGETSAKELAENLAQFKKELRDAATGAPPIDKSIGSYRVCH